MLTVANWPKSMTWMLARPHSKKQPLFLGPADLQSSSWLSTCCSFNSHTESRLRGGLGVGGGGLCPAWPGKWRWQDTLHNETMTWFILRSDGLSITAVEPIVPNLNSPVHIWSWMALLDQYQYLLLLFPQHYFTEYEYSQNLKNTGINIFQYWNIDDTMFPYYQFYVAEAKGQPNPP